jgi:ubiquinone/menaquinone biosynthesis C-methylase UbiE
MINRKDEIVNLCKGKNVFHLGFIQHSHMWRQKMEENDWLHSKISNVANEIVGLDYLEKDVKSIKEELGINAVSGDVMKLEDVNLNMTFDVIVCGELIEHIANPGLMLEGLKRFMNEETILIITTPNPWRDLWVKHVYNKHDESNWLNPEHVAWYSFGTLKQMLERYEYKEVKYQYYYAETKEAEMKTKNISILRKGWCLIRNILPNKYCENKNMKEKYEGLFFVTKI